MGSTIQIGNNLCRDYPNILFRSIHDAVQYFHLPLLFQSLLSCYVYLSDVKRRSSLRRGRSRINFWKLGLAHVQLQQREIEALQTKIFVLKRKTATSIFYPTLPNPVPSSSLIESSATGSIGIFYISFILLCYWLADKIWASNPFLLTTVQDSRAGSTDIPAK